MKLQITKNKGFSLVELSVSMAIIAIIAASALSIAITNDFQIKNDETKAKMDRIEEAIAGFLQLNYRLPCTADGSLLLTDANFGIEGTLTPAAGGVVCPNSNFTSGNIHSGVVPIRTLQLPDEFMFDGWGRRIAYVLDYRFANNQTTNTTCDGVTSTVCFIDTAAGSITINDASATARTTSAIFLLMSQGENGHGAYIKNGSATRINGFPAGNRFRDDSPDEIENVEFDNTGTDTTFDAIFVLKDFLREDDVTDANPEYFDDILRYRTKSQSLKDAGAILYDSICRDAKNIVDSPGSNSCTGAVSEAECERFATEIMVRCLE